ncbi:hypothetical protein SAVIM40S_02499 [Streptomyces avidinii]
MLLARLGQAGRDHLVHRGHAEAERGGPGAGEPADVGSRSGLRQRSPGRQQQLAAQQVRGRVRHLGGVHPVHLRRPRPREMPQPERPLTEQPTEQHGRRHRFPGGSSGRGSRRGPRRPRRPFRGG